MEPNDNSRRFSYIVYTYTGEIADFLMPLKPKTNWNQYRNTLMCSRCNITSAFHYSYLSTVYLSDICDCLKKKHFYWKCGNKAFKRFSRTISYNIRIIHIQRHELMLNKKTWTDQSVCAWGRCVIGELCPLCAAHQYLGQWWKPLA